MKLKPLNTIIAIFLSLIGFSFILTQPTFAASTSICDSSAPDEVKAASGCNTDKDGASADLSDAIVTILEAVIAISGLVAVTFILIGGINYMTSSGDASKIEKAKKTILYACSGLAICALSFAIVNWTIGAIKGKTGGQGNSSEQQSKDDD